MAQISPLLYTEKGAQLLSLRPGFGQSKIKDMNKMTLPELNTAYAQQNLRNIRKDVMKEAFEARGGLAKPPLNRYSVARVFHQGLQKQLFITERDTLYPVEGADDPKSADLAPVADAEEGEKAKKPKKKKKVDDEPKTQLNHKYQFPVCGHSKKQLECCFNEPGVLPGDFLSLSVFHDSNKHPENYINDDEKKNARDLIAKKKA